MPLRSSCESTSILTDVNSHSAHNKKNGYLHKEPHNISYDQQYKRISLASPHKDPKVRTFMATPNNALI